MERPRLGTPEDSESNASPRPVKLTIRFYVDSYHAWLLSRQITDECESNLRRVLSAFPPNAAIQTLVRFDRTPEMMAQLMAITLRRAEREIVLSYETHLAACGLQIVDREEALNPDDPFRTKLREIFGKSAPDLSGASYVEVISDGIVFAPERFDRDMEIRRVRKEAKKEREKGEQADAARLQWLSTNESFLAEGRYRFSGGGVVDFEQTQRFVDAVASEIGKGSRGGRFTFNWRGGEKPFQEKGVDTDLVIRVVDDLWEGDAEVFVFLTNDSDFAPLVERVRKGGKHVVLCGIESSSISTQLLRAMGGKRTFFDLMPDDPAFSSIELWCTKHDEQTLQYLSDVEMQWRWWESQGQV